MEIIEIKELHVKEFEDKATQKDDWKKKESLIVIDNHKEPSNSNSENLKV